MPVHWYQSLCGEEGGFRICFMKIGTNAWMTTIYKVLQNVYHRTKLHSKSNNFFPSPMEILIILHCNKPVSSSAVMTCHISRQKGDLRVRVHVYVHVCLL